jgi:predicted GNAT family acetyltransferase
MDDLTQKEGLFYLGEDDKPLALIKFSRKEGPVIVIEHTRVSETLKGRGIGGRLVEAVVGLAKEEGTKILPLCSYARAYLQKRAEYEDILA